MSKKVLCENKWYYLIYTIVAVFYFWMAAQIPYTHDDWDWGLDIGMHQFIYATVNSRYAGNFFEVIMTRSDILKTVIMGTTFFMIPYALSAIASSLLSTNKTSFQLFYFLLCNGLLLTMDRTIWSQTYGWIAGFANFSISIVFMVPWLQELFHIFHTDYIPQKFSFFRLSLLFVVCICSQLFLENIAIFHVLLALTFGCINFIKTRRILPKHIVMLLGSLIGLFIMFSSNLYDTLFSTGSAINDYRQIPMFHSQSTILVLLQMLKVGLSLLSQLYARNIVICFSIILTLINLLQKHQDEIPVKHYILASRINQILLFSLLTCFLINILFKLFIPSRATTIIKLAQLPVSSLFLLAVTINIWVIFRNKHCVFKQVFLLWIAAPTLIAPLVLTSETGSRLFFCSNILLILFLLCLLNYCIPYMEKTIVDTLIRSAILAMSVLLLFHAVIYAQIGSCKRIRDQIMNASLDSGTTEISLPAYPHQEYLHFPNPNEDWRIDYFKEFYGVSADVTIVFEE